MKNYIKSYWSLLLFISPLMQAYDTAYQGQVAQKHLNSFGQTSTKQESPRINTGKMWDVIKSLFQPSTFKIHKLSEYDMRERVNSLPTSDSISSQSILGINEVNKLDLVSGSGKNPQAHLLNALTHIDNNQIIKTKIGEKVLRELITQPTDVQTALSRADALKLLLRDQALMNNLKEQFKHYSSHESLFLKFFQEDELIEKELLDQVQWNKPWTKSLNNSTTGLEAGTFLSTATTAFVLLSVPLVFAYLYYKIDKGVKNQGGTGAWEYLKSQFLHSRKALLGTLAYTAFMGTSYAISVTHALGSFKINKNVNNLLQEYLIGAASCVNAMKQIYTVCSQHEKFKAFPEYKKIAYIFEQPEAEIAELISLFDTNTFKGDASFFSYKGRVLRAYNLMRSPNVQKVLVEAMQAVGLIDSLVTITEKVESLPKDAWCFTQFSPDNKPMIQATQFYNPFLNPAQAVKNDIIIGGPQPRGIILTGPNTGGKSTSMKALMLNTILSHTFGIACAKEFKTTQFKKLSCYMNITDDLAAGLSGLKAEADRAKEIVEEVKSLKNNEFAFIILDEIFTGTSPDQAMVLAERFITQLGACDRCLLVDATHFHNLIELEKKSPNIFKNYHVGAILNANNEVVKYTYTLEKGPSQVKNAGQVAAEYDL